MTTNKFLKLERQIAADERGSIVHRWQYGQALLAAKAGRKQLPHGLLDTLIKDAARSGITLTETEIRRRIRCGEAYDSAEKVGRRATDLGGWWALVDAGFPPVEPDGTDPDDIEAEGFGEPPDSWEQLQLELPGLKPVLTIRSRQVPVVRGEGGAKATDIRAYLQMCREKHDNYGKTVDRIAETFGIIQLGCAGDETMNAVEAYERGLALDAESEGAPGPPS